MANCNEERKEEEELDKDREYIRKERQREKRFIWNERDFPKRLTSSKKGQRKR